MISRLVPTRVVRSAVAACSGTAVGLLLLASSASAAAPAAPARPAYQFLRSVENWSVVPKLADHDPFDGLKFVRLDADGSTWASFGADFRARLEGWQDFNFGAPPNVSHDDTFLLTRFRTHADLHFDQTARVFLEVKGAYASDRDLPGGIRVIDQDKFELQQAFVDFKFNLGANATMVLRPGRQELAFGVQRLVSCLPWANSLRTWDGVQAIVTSGDWNITAIGTEFVPVDPGTGIGHANSDEKLYGVYAKRVTPGKPDGLEVYALRNEWVQPRNFNGTVGADRRWTLGVRQWGPFADRADYEVEFSYQLGSTGTGDVSAWSFASQLGYQLREDKTLRLWAGLDWATGDNTTGGDVGTFNQLYPLGHAYFGAMDVIGRQNIIDVSAGATWKAHPKVTLTLAGHSFSADSTDDAIYNAGGGVVRAGGTFQSSDIGFETNLLAQWNAARHVVVGAGLGRFFAGKAISQSGPSQDTNFWYLESTFTF
jgi:hypothetical protein